ncbi:MAG: hypothetical protein JW955_20805 [Sedimentisphaerales bacterium]|nr:hypothetical protein [Sedimentisphaerales bacterium]
MTTAAQIAANRHNAEKSTGPRTPEGKAIVSQNAVKHGLLSRRAVLNDEDPAQFDRHRTRLLEALGPAGPEEELTAERVVVLWWRLKRAERMQDEMLDYLMEADGTDSWTQRLRERGDPSASTELTFGRVVAREFSSGRTLEKLMGYERWIENSLYRSFNELHRLRREQQALKQSQSEEVSCSTPALGGDPSRGRLGYMVDGSPCETKPIGEVSSLKCEVSSGTGSGSSCETKPIEAVEPAFRMPATTSRSTGIPHLREGRPLPVILSHGRDAHATETPCDSTGGFETRLCEDGPVCKTKPIAR